MTTTPAQLAAQLGLAVPQRQLITPWCRDKTCTEPLPWERVDREDGSGLHALCTELVAPAVLAGPTEAQAVANILATGAEVIEGGPCMDAWCAKNGRPCGFDVAAHINAHGPSILTNPATGPTPQTAPVPAAAPTPAALVPTMPVPGPTFTAPEQFNVDDVHRVKTAVLAQQYQPIPSPLTPPGTFSAPAGPHPLKAEMIKIIRWADATTPRSLQREIGMSEVGADCLRRLAYRLAELPDVNTTVDPWFSIMGKAVHAWLAETLAAWNNAPEYGGPVFQIEQRVVATSDQYGVAGSTDFYRNALVGDHKLVGADALRKYRDNGPSNQYRVQVHVNGLGWEQAGWPVDEVAILFYPRSGYLDSMHVWSEPYNRQVALDALARLASVRQLTAVLAPHGAYGNIPAQPDKAGCVWCPFYRPGAPADATGCPGK
jgi:hypothetical protein